MSDPNDVDATDDREYTIDDYWLALYRRKWIILLVTILAAVAAGVISRRIDPQYEAVVVFYVPQDATTQFESADRTRPRLPPPGAGEHAKSFAMILEQPDTRQAVLESIQPHYDQPIRTFVDIVVPRVGLISIHARDEDPQLAADVANGYVAYFNGFLGTMVDTDVARSLENIEGRLEDVRARIKRATAERQAYQQKHQVASISVKIEELERQRSAFEQRLADARVATSAILRRIDTTKEQLTAEAKAYQDERIVLSTDVITSLLELIALIEVDIAGTRAELKPDHPTVVTLRERHLKAKEALDREIKFVNESESKLENSLYAKLREDLSRQYVEHSDAAAREEGLQREMAQIDRQILDLPVVSARLEQYDEQLEEQRDLEGQLQSSRNDLVTSSLQIRQTGLVVERAKPPMRASFPILPLNIAVALVAGLIAGILYALLLEHLAGRKRVAKLRHLRRREWAIALAEEAVE